MKRPSGVFHRNLNVLFFKIFALDNFNQEGDLRKLKYLKGLYPDKSTIYAFAKDQAKEAVKDLKHIDETLPFEEGYKSWARLPMTLQRLRKIKFDCIALPYKSKRIKRYTKNIY